MTERMRMMTERRMPSFEGFQHEVEESLGVMMRNASPGGDLEPVLVACGDVASAQAALGDLWEEKLLIRDVIMPKLFSGTASRYFAIAMPVWVAAFTGDDGGPLPSVRPDREDMVMAVFCSSDQLVFRHARVTRRRGVPPVLEPFERVESEMAVFVDDGTMGMLKHGVALIRAIDEIIEETLEDD